VLRLAARTGRLTATPSRPHHPDIKAEGVSVLDSG